MISVWEYAQGSQVSSCRFDAVKALRDMEEFTREVGGYPFLYADIFMTRKEFDEMFDLRGKH